MVRQRAGTPDLGRPAASRSTARELPPLPGLGGRRDLVFLQAETRRDARARAQARRVAGARGRPLGALAQGAAEIGQSAVMAAGLAAGRGRRQGRQRLGTALGAQVRLPAQGPAGTAVAGMTRGCSARLFTLERVPARRTGRDRRGGRAGHDALRSARPRRRATRWSGRSRTPCAWPFAAWYGGFWAGSADGAVRGASVARLRGARGRALGRRGAARRLPHRRHPGALRLLARRVARGRSWTRTHLARTDQLTGVANSRAFYEAAGRGTRADAPLRRRLHAGLHRRGRLQERQRPASATRRETTCSRSLARTLTEDTRSTDELARIGGDEFVLLMPETAPGGGRGGA